MRAGSGFNVKSPQTDAYNTRDAIYEECCSNFHCSMYFGAKYTIVNGAGGKRLILLFTFTQVLNFTANLRYLSFTLSIY